MAGVKPLLETIGALLPKGIKAWHASPHDFDKVDLSKIGTGQGAQSYGPGFYAAESPKVSGVGGEYWKEFAGKMQRDFYQPHEGSKQLALQFLTDAGGDKKKAIEWLEQINKNTPNAKQFGMREDALELLRSGEQVGPRVYELNIKADPRSFLQWDEPLSAQPQIVGKLNKAGWDLPPKLHDLTYLRQKVAENGPDSWYADQLRSVEGIGQKTGAEFKPNTVEDMARLREAGIPGIRYADAASRAPVAAQSRYEALATAKKRLFEAEQKGAKQWEIDHYRQAVNDADALIRREVKATPRTYNYVINNPDIIEIMRKLAIPGMVGGAASVYQPQGQQ